MMFKEMVMMNEEKLERMSMVLKMIRCGYDFDHTTYGSSGGGGKRRRERLS